MSKPIPTEADLLDELEAALQVQHIQDGDVTRAQLAAKLGCGEKAATDKMKPLVDSGAYTEHYVIGRRGRWCWVYRRAR